MVCWGVPCDIPDNVPLKTIVASVYSMVCWGVPCNIPDNVPLKTNEANEVS